MGSIMSAISDDIDTYEHLCGRYGEKVQYSHGSANPYGEHCEELKWKVEQDRRAEEGLEYDYLELCERFGEEPRWHRHEKLPAIAGFYAKRLEDRAREEDGEPPRVEKPGARAGSYVSIAGSTKPKTRFDRI
jgi:predicted HicB family RNase H-like nuclease